jgi:hypothetical protein
MCQKKLEEAGHSGSIGRIREAKEFVRKEQEQRGSAA